MISWQSLGTLGMCTICMWCYREQGRGFKGGRFNPAQRVGSPIGDEVIQVDAELGVYVASTHGTHANIRTASRNSLFSAYARFMGGEPW